MLDTLMYVKRLEAVGIPREQAETQVEIMSEVINSNLATKQDLKDQSTDLRQEIKNQGIELRQEIKDQGIELRQEIRAQGIELEKQITAIKADMLSLENRIIIKLGAMMILGFGALATLIQLH